VAFSIFVHVMMQQTCHLKSGILLLAQFVDEVVLYGSVSSALQLVTIYYHMLNGKYIVQLRGLPKNSCVALNSNPLQANVSIKLNTITALGFKPPTFKLTTFGLVKTQHYWLPSFFKHYWT
jgi:hypothetical protein